PRSCLAFLTAFGKRHARTGRALDSAFPLPRASSKRTAVESGSRAHRIAARPSHLRFPRPPRSEVGRRGPAVRRFSKVTERLRVRLAKRLAPVAMQTANQTLPTAALGLPTAMFGPPTPPPIS